MDTARIYNPKGIKSDRNSKLSFKSRELTDYKLVRDELKKKKSTENMGLGV